ncbi:MAG: hypothetical protein AB7G28_16575 [Pirellulales bacterium]
MPTKREFHAAMRPLLAGIASFILLLPTAAWAENEVLLSMPEPPDGYMVVKQPIEVDGKRGGVAVIVGQEGPSSNVVITVETSFDRSTKPARVAATKAYVNGAAGTLKNHGMKLVDSKLPDLEQADFTRPLQVDMTFDKPDGTKLYLRQFVFFTKYGYNIQIGASNPEELETLAKWAQRIKPAE